MIDINPELIETRKEKPKKRRKKNIEISKSYTGEIWSN
jgi:hypothetical protein